MMKIAVAILSVVGGNAMSDNPVIHPPQHVPEGWEMTGENADTMGNMDVLVGLRRSNLDMLQKIFDASSTPGHPDYLKHASWKEMGDIVRPSDAAMGAVVGMLASKGATGIHVAAHGDYVKASVPMSELEVLTEGHFQVFQQTTTGRRITRLCDGVKLPAAIAKHVQTFSGLHGFPLDASPVLGNTASSPPQPASAGARLGTNRSTALKFEGFYVTPTVINKAYGIDPKSVKRSGKTNIQAIGQFQGEYVSPEDLSKFCKQYDSEADCSIQKFIGQNDERTPTRESMLDVEYITGVGAGVPTWVYSYPSIGLCGDLLSWANEVSSESEHPSVVSLSYGSQEIGYCDNSTVARFSEDVQKLGAMGITVVIGSGDDGSGLILRQGGLKQLENNQLSPAFPASIPYALSVGATTFVSGVSGEEMATTAFGSGGGFSYDFDVPSYQASAVNAYLAQTAVPLCQYGKNGSHPCQYGKNGRGTPDVASLGENFVFIMDGESGSQSGTSASAPSWAGIIALLNEECLSASGGKKTLGFINPLLYKNPDAFTDITKGTNGIGLNKDYGWKCAKGWDAATGLGTPQFPKLQNIVRTACSSAANTVVV